MFLLSPYAICANKKLEGPTSAANRGLTGCLDAVVIGGGFYGGCLAAFLAERFRRVLLVEKEPDLLTRASFVNQARVHNGYH